METQALRVVATVFLRRRPLVVAPMFVVVIATLAFSSGPRNQLGALAVFGSLAVSFFVWEAQRGRSKLVSRQHLLVSLLVTLGGIAFASAATGGAESPLLLLAFAPTVVGFAAFGRGRTSDVLLASAAAVFTVLALLPSGMPFPALALPQRRFLMVVCGASALVLLRLGVSALTDAHAAAREAVAGVGEDLVAGANARTAALEAMGAKVAHEVRNPLSAIKGLVEVMAEKCADDRDRRRLEVVRGEVDRIEEILTGYLALARPLDQVTPQSCDAGRLVREVAAVIEGRAERAGVSVVVEDGAGELTADPRRLKEALLNLLLNALAVTPGGGRVVLRAQVDPKSVSFEVEDGGSGFSETMRTNAGTPFVSAREGGTGLGLALARQAAEQHGGTLTLDSKRGKRTVARIRLPRNVTRGEAT